MRDRIATTARAVLSAALASLVVITMLPAPAHAATAGPDATVMPTDQPQIRTGLSAQPAGGWTIDLNRRYDVQTGDARLVLAVRDSTGANCAEPDATIGYGATPTVEYGASPANGNTGTPLDAVVEPSADCYSVGINDELVITVPTDVLPMTITITNVIYDVGIATAPGAVRVSVTGSCTIAGCDPGFEDLNSVTPPGYFANAIVNPVVVPGLPDLEITSHRTAFNADGTRLDVTAAVTNQGHVTSQATKVEFDGPGWTYTQPVPEIAVGETVPITATFVLTDAVRGSRPTFQVTVDPDGELQQDPGDARTVTFAVPIPLVPPATSKVTTATTATDPTATSAGTTTTTAKQPDPPVSPSPKKGWAWWVWVGLFGGGLLGVALAGLAWFRWLHPTPTPTTPTPMPPPSPDPQWSVGPFPEVQVAWAADVDLEVADTSDGPALGFAIRFDPRNTRFRWEAL